MQPYRDLVRLMHKEVVLAENASWLFRAIPYLIFAATWVAASLVPTFRPGLLFSWSADLIAIIALLGSARFFLALAGLDVGTSFGGIGSSREMMFASLAEPAMLMIVFTLALVAVMTSIGLGFLLPNSLRIWWELRRPEPNRERIVRINGINIWLAGTQGLLQIVIIIVMAKFVS